MGSVKIALYIGYIVFALHVKFVFEFFELFLALNYKHRNLSGCEFCQCIFHKSLIPEMVYNHFTCLVKLLIMAIKEIKRLSFYKFLFLDK